MLAVAGALILAGCQSIPTFAPPEQRQPMSDVRPYRVRHVADFRTGDATRVVSDILPPAGGWSWTRKRPTVKAQLRGLPQVFYEIDFAIADATFKETGPVAITFLVNDHALDTIRYDKPGPQRYEKLVPSDWLQLGKENFAAAEIDKVWTSPDDGAKLGFILNRMGLSEQ